MKLSRCVFGALIIVALCDFSYAQGERHPTPTVVGSFTTNYYFAKPSELTITVDVLGAVLRPGRYEISNKVNLVNLLALAGGTATDGSLNEVRITRLIETEGGVKVSELKVNLDEISHVSPDELVLHPGDVIQVDRTGWSTFRDVFSAVVSLAIITSAVAQVIYFTK